VEIRCSQSKELTFFGESIVGEANRGLDFLRAIEETIFAINLITDNLVTYSRYASMSIDKFQNVKLDSMCDESGKIADELNNAQAKVLELYNMFISKRHAARNDQNLSHDDGVEDCYTSAIAAAADLHNLLNDLRWEIYEHDADFEKSETSNVLSTNAEIEAFFANI
jgi:hypothetical protein